MKTRHFINVGLIATQVLLPLLLGVTVLFPQQVFATDQSDWTSCTRRALVYIHDSEPGLEGKSINDTITAIKNTEEYRNRFKTQYETSRCQNENFARSQNLTAGTGDFDPIAVVNAYLSFRSPAQVASDATGGSGGGGGSGSGSTPTSQPTAAQALEWKNCVINSLRALSLDNSNIIDNDIDDAISKINSDAGTANSFTVFYNGRGCPDKAFATNSSGPIKSTTSVGTIISVYSSIGGDGTIGGGTGGSTGGGTGGAGSETTGATSAEDKEAESTCGSFLGFIKDMTGGNLLKGLMHLGCSIIYLGKFFERSILTLMGADSANLTSLGLTGKISTGGVTVKTGAGASE